MTNDVMKYFLREIRLVIFDRVSLFELEVRTNSKMSLRFIQRSHTGNAISNDQKSHLFIRD